jgi:hypothetical protein
VVSSSPSASPSPGPPIPSDIRLIRRLRQSPHLTDEDVQLFFSAFILDIETGAALASGYGSDPQISLQWSDDGGYTWCDEQPMSLGVQGATRMQINWLRLGKSRDRVWRITTDAPIPIHILDAYVDVKKGTS